MRITNFALLYVLLALGLNIVVGFAGLLDLGYVAFYAVGAYIYALLASPHFDLHLPFWVILPLGAAVAALFGVLLGAPTLKLRGDYLAIVTLGFGEIIRIFLNNLSRPVNITNGPQGIARHRPDPPRRLRLRQHDTLSRLRVQRPDQVLLPAARCARSPSSSSTLRLQNSRIGRAWVAIREDEIAAAAMGINTRNLKLLAFAMGATFGGVAGGMFSAIQGFISPESFMLIESIMVVSMVVLGGMGNIWGVILGALLLSFVPEVLRWTVEPAAACAVRPHGDRARGDPHAAVRARAGADHAVPPGGPAAVGGATSASSRSAARRRRASAVSAAARGDGVAKRFGGLQALCDVGLRHRSAARSTA